METQRPRVAPTREDVVARYRSGESMASIARRYGANPPTIRDVLLRRAISLRSEGAAEATGERRRVVSQMYLGGQTMQQVADHFNLSRERVRQILRKAGTKSRPQGSRRYNN